MVRNYYRLLIVILCFLMGLQVWGLLSTSGLNWGFHFLGLLPIHFKIFYFAVAIAAIVYFSRKPELKFLDRIQHFMVNKPYYFITLIIIGFIICAVTLRVRVPLLGDGFYIVKNFSEALRGAAPLDLRNEPLSTIYFFWISKILNVSSYNGLLNTFLIADTILGIVFIIAIFYLTRSIFTEPQEQLLSFLFLLSVPYLQLFFGYVETYSGVLLLLTLYLLTAFLYLKQKLPYTSAAVTFLAMFFSHYLSLLLLPSLIYLTMREKQVNGTNNIVKAIGMMVVIILIVLVMINFDVENFYAWVPHSHFLPLSFSTEPVERYSEPYTLFSFFHGVDIFNYIILMASGAVYFLLLTYFRSRNVFLQSIESKFLILASFPVLILLFILKFDLGMAKDWDNLSPYF
ncbi:MAG: hypothetical protein HY800_02750, partial [Ignavibacteriales bacterium]|nr:hypothetical protein [Ignavibacteriales bacterium]